MKTNVILSIKKFWKKFINQGFENTHAIEPI